MVASKVETIITTSQEGNLDQEQFSPRLGTFRRERNERLAEQLTVLRGFMPTFHREALRKGLPKQVADMLVRQVESVWDAPAPQLPGLIQDLQHELFDAPFLLLTLPEQKVEVSYEPSNSQRVFLWEQLDQLRLAVYARM